MENDLHTFTFTRADWMRIEQALRAQAKDNQTKMDKLGERGVVYDHLCGERNFRGTLADDIQWKIVNY